MLDNKESVQQFIDLQNKSKLELRAICEGMGLSTEGSKSQLIDRLLSLGFKPQDPVIRPQLIPLRTKDNRSNPLPGAANTYRKWRVLIFQSKTKKRFHLLNSQGKPYVAHLKYIKCNQNTMQDILKNKWHLPTNKQKDLISLIAKEPNRFWFNIVQKPDKNGNTFMMLHVCLKNRSNPNV